jgi:hypothetical protein
MDNDRIVALARSLVQAEDEFKRRLDEFKEAVLRVAPHVKEEPAPQLSTLREETMLRERREKSNGHGDGAGWDVVEIEVPKKIGGRRPGSGAKPNERTAKIVEMAKRGMKPREIAAELQIKPQWVWNTMTYARGKGLLAPKA